MSKSSANAEPSMEEILASIRQIISDEDAPTPDAAPEAEPELESAPDEEISEADLDALFADSGSSDDEPAEEETAAADDFDAVPVAADEPDESDEPDDDVLDLGEVAQADTMDEPFDPPEDLDFSDPEPEPEAEPEPELEEEPIAAFEAVEPYPAEPPKRLLSNESDQAVSAAFASLATTMLSGNARTIEELIQDMLRPMLKAWLDENLPTMVEKMVREEIERVARRGPRT